MALNLKKTTQTIEKQKTFQDFSEGSYQRGSWRIRTAVVGFADRCLATRPTNLVFRSAKIVLFTETNKRFFLKNQFPAIFS